MIRAMWPDAAFAAGDRFAPQDIMQAIDSRCHGAAAQSARRGRCRSAAFVIGQGHDKAVTGVAEHLMKFWDPRMRDSIVSYLEAGGAGLDPCVHEAVGRLRAAREEAVPKSA